MAILAISGRPGSGKSYEAVISHILPALKQGRKVVTNIPLKVDWFVAVLGEQVRDLIVLVDGGFHQYGGKRYFSDAEHFLRYQEWRNDRNQGVFFVVDECHLSLPSAPVAGQKEDLRLVKEYLSMHRHYGHDLLLLTQNFRKVSRDVTDMVQTCYYTTKLSFLGNDKKYVCKVADGVSRNIVAEHIREYEQKYFAAYQSHTKSEGSVQEANLEKLRAWYKHPFFYAAGFMVMLSIFLFVNLLTRDSEADAIRAKYSNNQQIQKTTPIEPVPVKTVQVTPDQHLTPKNDTQVESAPKSHPYDSVQMHVVGHSQDFNRRGVYQKLIYILLSRNGQALAEITHADLALAGYEYKVLNDCMIELSFQDKFHDYIFCDAPTITVSLPTDSLDHKQAQ